MNTKHKIIYPYILVIIVSAVVLTLNTYMVSKLVFGKGYSKAGMETAADGIGKTLKETSDLESVKKVVTEYYNKYKGMEIEILRHDFSIIYSTMGNYGSYSPERIIEITSEYKRAVDNINFIKKENNYYVKVTVPKRLSLSDGIIHNDRNNSIAVMIGLIIFSAVLIGLQVFLIWYVIHFFIHLRNIFKIIDNYEVGQNQFAFDNCLCRNDEINKIYSAFARMAKKIEKQIEEIKTIRLKEKEFIAQISHDVKTPLTSVIGYLESLENNIYDNSQDREKALMIIKKKAKYIEALFKEMLTSYKIETIQSVRNEAVNITEFLREIIIEYMDVLEKEEFKYSFSIPEEEIIIECDPELLARAVKNIIDNALKYGIAGKYFGIEFRDRMKYIEIDIEDHGQGIENEAIPDLFSKFNRGSRKKTRDDSSTGMGLSIAYDIVTKHGGELRVNSTKGKTVFTIKLPEKMVKNW